MKRGANIGKKLYHQPALVASNRFTASMSVCGWFTQCGKYVKCRK